MALVDVENLSYRYPQTAVPALRAVSLTIEVGELVTVIGANEAGKSTLCYALTGYAPHFFHGEMAGEVRLNGRATTAQTLPQLTSQAGLLFQNPATQLSGVRDTVLAEVAFGLENLGVPPVAMGPRIEEAMALTEVAHLADRQPQTLSGGQQQRVALAAMLAMRPRLLVLDEPTAQLDPLGSRAIFTALHQLSRRGMTLVLATHNLAQAAVFSDRFLLLHQGRVVRAGTPQAVLTDPQLATFGVAPLPVTVAARAAQAQGWWPRERPLPVTLVDAIAGFQQARAGGR